MRLSDRLEYLTVQSTNNELSNWIKIFLIPGRSEKSPLFLQCLASVSHGYGVEVNENLMTQCYLVGTM